MQSELVRTGQNAIQTPISERFDAGNRNKMATNSTRVYEDDQFEIISMKCFETAVFQGFNVITLR